MKTIHIGQIRPDLPVKPMHGIGQPPFFMNDFSLFHYLKEAGIPYSRLHDVGGWLGGGLYVDIPNIFRDFDADENDPDSYDFAFTDRLIQKLTDEDCEPFFRLGVTIENDHMMKTYRLFPPKDPAKWARICEHIIRHYNEGWANGFHAHITYWEIWNEPDDCYTNETAAMWKGTPEQYYELYDVTARHLKRTFGDSVKIGGYGHCGFYACDRYPDPTDISRRPEDFFESFFSFLHGFLTYIRAHGSPLDFFSWHIYSDVPTTVKHARVCRAILDAYGYRDTEDILDEWNTCYDKKLRSSPMAASKILATMLAMQREKTAVLCFYDAALTASNYAGVFNPDTWEPYPAYYAFRAFGEAYRRGTVIESSTDAENVYTLAAVKEDDPTGKRVLLVSNLNEEATELCLDVPEADLADAEVRTVEPGCIYELNPDALCGTTLHLNGLSFAEVRF